MASATKFMFGTDFREGSRRAVGEAELVAARAEGFKAGEEQGRQQADAKLMTLSTQIARSAERLLAQENQRCAEIEAQAVHVALAAARRLAGAALEDRPTAALERAMRECFAHARLAPHLVLRVHEGAVEASETLVKRLAQECGFAGRLVLLGDPDIAPGDARIEWADGGFMLDTQRLAELVEEAVADVFGAPAARGMTN